MKQTHNETDLNLCSLKFKFNWISNTNFKPNYLYFFLISINLIGCIVFVSSYSYKDNSICGYIIKITDNEPRSISLKSLIQYFSDLKCLVKKTILRYMMKMNHKQKKLSDPIRIC